MNSCISGVGTRNKLSKLKNHVPIKINDKNVKFVKQHNYLGVVLDCEMSPFALYIALYNLPFILPFIFVCGKKNSRGNNIMEQTFEGSARFRLNVYLYTMYR